MLKRENIKFFSYNAKNGRNDVDREKLQAYNVCTIISHRLNILKDPFITGIGEKIRNLRQAANLTQWELADRADLTDGFISQVERGLTSISIDSLKHILDVLNVSLSEFFRDIESVPVVFSPKESATLEIGEGARLHLPVKGATNRKMEPAILTLRPGSTTEIMSPFQGDILGMVLKGRVQIIYGREVHRAKARDCFYCTGDRDFRIVNPYRTAAEVLWVTSPPNF